ILEQQDGEVVEDGAPNIDGVRVESVGAVQIRQDAMEVPASNDDGENAFGSLMKQLTANRLENNRKIARNERPKIANLIVGFDFDGQI
ncbi:hypothetical protein U1Q18_037262, partial [Sarracenia purpurea var. burkii]